MQRKIRICGFVGTSILLVVLAPYVVYFVGPLFALAHRLALGLSALASIVALPVVAYHLAVNKRDGTEHYFAIPILVWLICASTRPNVEVRESFTVFGLAGKYHDSPATEEVTCHCLEDAKLIARKLYKDRETWARNDEGKFEVCDVKIETFSFRPALEWYNTLFGAHTGRSSSNLSIRWLDDSEDPLGITDASTYYEPEPYD